jgi:hypothetical protein
MANDLVEDLKQGFRQHLLSVMPPDSGGELTSLPLGTLLIRWFNWQDRYVPAIPRTVHKSSELSASPAAVTHSAALAAVRSAIEAGRDLTPRLSTRVGTAYVPSTLSDPLHRRDDLDLLLADWGIHHLHLSPLDDARRTSDLLFAMFRSADAYLIQILPHGSWTDEALLEIVARNWPDAGLLMGSISGIRLAEPIAPPDRARYRRAGVATAIEIDGTVYLPRSQTTAGTALDLTMHANSIMTTLAQWNDMLQRNELALDEQAAGLGAPSPQPGHWEPFISDHEIGFENTLARSMRLTLAYY